MAKTIEITHLIRAVKELHNDYPHWTLDNAFVHWFLQAFLVPTAEKAAEAVTGVSHDKGVDGVLVDDDTRKVFLLQGKFHQGPTPPLENRSDVMAFTQVAHKLVSKEAEFSAFLETIDGGVAKRLERVRKRVKERHYSVHLYYVTTGRCSAALKSEAEAEAAQVNAVVEISILDRAEVLSLLADFLMGAAPPVPFLDLRIDPTGIVGSDGVLQRFDKASGIGSWIVTMTGKDAGGLFAAAGERLFARNIRGFLGDTAINAGMKRSLESEPEHFWYFNNGITIVCNSARKTSESGETILRVTNPQIINGQQTTRVLNKWARRDAAVVVRVISIPREADGGAAKFEKLVSNIVAATNWQNAIYPSDLRSNDGRQIALERDLAKLHYHYLRKRQTKHEAKKLLSNHYWFRIKKEELAQIVGACDLDPYEVRSGKEGLFEEPNYDLIFNSRGVRDYLAMYWLGRLVKYEASGYPDRAYAKWHAMHFVAARVLPLLRSRAAADVFRQECERDTIGPNLYKAIDEVFLGLLAFYRLHRGRGAQAADISTFFYRPRLLQRFESYWKGSKNTRRGRFAKRIRLFAEEMREKMAGTA